MFAHSFQLQRLPVVVRMGNEAGFCHCHQNYIRGFQNFLTFVMINWNCLIWYISLKNKFRGEVYVKTTKVIIAFVIVVIVFLSSVQVVIQFYIAASVVFQMLNVSIDTSSQRIHAATSSKDLHNSTSSASGNVRTQPVVIRCPHMAAAAQVLIPTVISMNHS